MACLNQRTCDLLALECRSSWRLAEQVGLFLLTKQMPDMQLESLLR